MNNTGRFLPLGTVVLLKGATKRLMITGYAAYDKGNTAKAYDYSGCLYPEGIITSDQLALFDNKQIDKVFHMVYSDEEDKKFKKALEEEILKISNTQANKQINQVQNNGQVNLDLDPKN